MKKARKRGAILAVAFATGFLWADPPVFRLADGGIQFPDGTVQETSAVLPQGPPTLTVVVDCDGGDSISEALSQPADELTIEISGFCDEAVDLSRPNVTLRGVTPLFDGIHSTSTQLNVALLIRNAFGVTIENLSLSGDIAGLAVNFAFGVTCTNCRLENSGYTGAFIAASRANLQDTVVTGNGNRGLYIENGGRVSMNGCTVQDNGTDSLGKGVWVEQGSEAVIVDSIVTGGYALDLRGPSRAYVSGASTVIEGLPDPSGFGAAIRATGTVSVELANASIVGPLSLQQKSVIKLTDANHAVPAGFNFANVIGEGSTLLVFGTTALDGDVQVREFANAVFSTGSSVAGDLDCSSGGDAYCDDPAVVSGTASCRQCTSTRSAARWSDDALSSRSP